MTDPASDDVEAALRALGRAVRYPEMSDMTGAVMARITRAPSPVRRRASRPGVMLVAAATVAALLIVGIGVSPSARRAVAGWLGVDGITITFENDLPRVGLGSDLALGEQVPLDAAQDAVDYDIAVPTELGAPDGVFLARSVDGGEVTLVWDRRSGLPASRHTGVGALLTQFVGSAAPESFKKLAVEGTKVTPVMVDGESGFFVEGDAHVLVRDRSGDERTLSSRLAGNTLLWSDGGVTYRLEAQVGLQHAVRIATSLAPAFP